MLEVTQADWDAILAINLTAPFFLAQALAPAMIAKGGDALSTSLRCSRFARFRWARLRRFERRNRAADACAGGSVVAARRERERDSAGVLCDRTDRAGCQRRRALAEDGRQHIFGSQWRAGDLRGTAVFLASRASDYVTGQTIFVDGGFSAG